MTQIELPTSHRSSSFFIDDSILGEIISPRSVLPASDPDVVINDALDNPIGTDKIEQKVKPGQQIALIIDDITRKTPTKRILRILINRFIALGVQSNDVHIVIALGTHRPMTSTEIIAKVGLETSRIFKINNAPCWDDSQFVFLGESSSGIPAYVNRVVAEADVRIGIGEIVPHSTVGYSGGAKIILPGVCNTQTVNNFHARSALYKDNLLGVVESPMRVELEKFVKERIGLDFIINIVPTREGHLYKCVAGDFMEAHRVGVRNSSYVYGVQFSKQCQILISNSYPADLDLWQSSKALWTGEGMVCDEGILIFVTTCLEGLGVHELFADYMNLNPNYLRQCLKEGKIEDPNACAGAIQIGDMKRRIRFGLVSGGLTEEDATRMGFEYFNTIEDAIKKETRAWNEVGSVSVLTHGSVTIPILK